MATQAWLEARLKGEELPKPEGLLTQNEELWEPLYACYQSLQACGMGIIANGDLLDTLRRVKCFGVPLVRIDIRQESTRHTEALGELTRYLGIGDYESWSEADKQAFLIRELNSKRPLLPRNWQPSAETREVLDTCRDCRSAARLHCRLRDLDGENAVRRAGCPPAAERSGYRVCNAGCSAV